MSSPTFQRLASVSLALVLAGCLNPTIAETVTPRAGPPVRSVSLELDSRGKYNVPDEDRPALLTAIAAGLARRGITVVPAGSGVPLLIANVQEYRPVPEDRRDEWGMPDSFGRFEATWRLTDASGAQLGECRTGGATSLVSGREWGEVMQEVGESLAEFLLQS